MDAEKQPDEPEIIIEDENGTELAAEAPAVIEPEVVIADPEPEKSAEDDPYRILERQLEELKADRELKARRIQEYESQQAVQQRDQLETQRALIEHARQTALGEVRAAKSAFKEAMASGDYEAVAEAQEAISAAQLDARQYEMAGQELQRHLQQRAPQRAPAGDPVEAQLQNLSPPAREWARRNRQDLFDNPNAKARQDKALALHTVAVSDGIKPDTPAYFEYLDQHMGYATSGKPAKSATERRPAMPSAPVSRTANASGGNRVVLSAAEVQMAKKLGMDPIKYAANKKTMLEKAGDPEWRGPRYGEGNSKG